MIASSAAPSILGPAAPTLLSQPPSLSSERWALSLARRTDPTHHCIFLIDDVPVRFLRADTEDSSRRTLCQRGIEAQQLALALGTANGSEDPMFRPAVRTSEGGEVTRVVFLALRGEEGTMEYS